MKFLILTIQVFLLSVSIYPDSGGDKAGIRRFAFVVGKNNGGEKREVLKYANSDAKMIAGVLQEYGGVKKEDTVLLLDPDKEEFISALDKLELKIKNIRNKYLRSELFFYYSGHSDKEGLLLGESRVLYKKLKDIVKTSFSDISVLILDSCASGTLIRLKGGQKRQPFLIDQSSNLKGHAIITSSSSDESSQESDRIKGSYFSHYLASGLRGAADNSNDGKVTLNEAYNFAYNETLASTQKTYHGAQHPSYEIKLNGSGNLVITDLRKSTAKMVIAKNIRGNIYVRNSNDDLIVEVNKKKRKELQLALAPDSYTVTLKKDDNRYYESNTLVDKKPVYLTMADFKISEIEYAVARGGTDYNRYGNLLVGYSLDEVIVNHLTVKFGFENAYGIFDLGIKPKLNSKGVGAGLRFGFNKTYINFETMFSFVGYNGLFGDGGKIIRLGLFPSFRINKYVHIFGGTFINVFIDKSNGYSNEYIRQGKAKWLGISAGASFRVL